MRGTLSKPSGRSPICEKAISPLMRSLVTLCMRIYGHWFGDNSYIQVICQHSSSGDTLSKYCFSTCFGVFVESERRWLCDHDLGMNKHSHMRPPTDNKNCTKLISGNKLYFMQVCYLSIFQMIVYLSFYNKTLRANIVFI